MACGREHWDAMVWMTGMRLERSSRARVLHCKSIDDYELMVSEEGGTPTSRYMDAPCYEEASYD